MDNKVKYIITCRFSGWSYVKDPTHETGSDLSKTEHRGDGKDEYPAFGVKYLITVPLSIVTEGTEPKEEMKEEDWESLRQPEQNVAEYAKKVIAKMTGEEFDGEILFIEQSDLVIL